MVLGNKSIRGDRRFNWRRKCLGRLRLGSYIILLPVGNVALSGYLYPFVRCVVHTPGLHSFQIGLLVSTDNSCFCVAIILIPMYIIHWLLKASVSLNPV